MENQLDQCQRIYDVAKENFFASFSVESADKLKQAMVFAADDVATNLNWYLASPTLLKAGVWDAIRCDMAVHVSLIKFEQMLMATSIMHGIDRLFVDAINNMFFISTKMSKDVVDSDFIATNSPAESSFDVMSMPGVLGLMSIVLFRKQWM